MLFILLSFKLREKENQLDREMAWCVWGSLQGPPQGWKAGDLTLSCRLELGLVARSKASWQVQCSCSRSLDNSSLLSCSSHQYCVYHVMNNLLYFHSVQHMFIELSSERGTKRYKGHWNELDVSLSAWDSRTSGGTNKLTYLESAVVKCPPRTTHRAEGTQKWGHESSWFVGAARSSVRLEQRIQVLRVARREGGRQAQVVPWRAMPGCV